jgi:hypothetical protein
MILQGFKEKSNKKYLNSILNTPRSDEGNSKIVSLGIIVNVDETDDLEILKSLATTLRVRPNKLKIIAFTSNKKDVTYSWDVCFNPKDFGWKGTIKNIELQSFLDTDFDALISYYTLDILELKLLTAKSKAKFKIGILQSEKRLNDLIINTKLKDFDVFRNEVYKYLKIFNKIKHE